MRRLGWPTGLAADRRGGAKADNFCPILRLRSLTRRSDDQHDELGIGGERMSGPLSPQAVAPDLWSWRA